MMKLRILGTSLIGGLALATTLVAPAHAATFGSGAQPPTNHQVQTTYAPECVAQVEALNGSAADRDACKVTTTTTTDSAVSISRSEALSDPGLSSAARSEIAASASAAFTAKGYSQFTTGGDYTVTHGGTFYFDGSRVWVGTAYKGATGSHNCVVNYTTLGVGIQNIQCAESGTTSNRAMNMNWFVIRGPYQYNFGMTANLSSTGVISGANTTSPPPA